MPVKRYYFAKVTNRNIYNMNLFTDIMSISKIVRISELYPSKVRDLSKSFREMSAIHRPYGLSSDDSNARQIQKLVEEVETGLNIRDPERRNEPYSSNLDERVDAVNSATTIIESDSSRQVPEEIRFIQLAHFHHPEIDGQQYSYGLMMHFGDYLGQTREFAVLVPFEREKNVPAIMLSNGQRINDPLESMVKALVYARQRGNT